MKKPAKNCLVAIVEDEADIRETISELLTLEGYRVVAFRNGSEALEGLSSVNEPCVILLDWKMPVMGGEEFLQKRSSYPAAASRAPVFIVSSFADELRGVKGVAGLMNKPINPVYLMAALEAHTSVQWAEASAL